MSVPFRPDPRLAADGPALGELGLCHVRLVDDARFPWIVLIPRRANAIEIIDLSVDDRTLLMDEIAHACTALKAVSGAQKLNVAALGNVVPELHIHVVGRNVGDAAWPGPVFGVGQRQPHDAAAREHLMARLRTALGV